MTKDYSKVIEALNSAHEFVLDANFNLLRAVNYDGNYHPMSSEELDISKKICALSKRINKLLSDIYETL